MNRPEMTTNNTESSSLHDAAQTPEQSSPQSPEYRRFRAMPEQGKLHIAFLLYEGMTLLDLIGPVEVLAGPWCSVDFVSRDLNPVYAENTSNNRLGLIPTATFADITSTDIICVPGTSNPYAQIVQTDMIEWLASVGNNASWVTSVCTGSFLLGAAGLLKGIRATSHWAVVEQLRHFGAEPVRERVVRHGNRVTGAGVTAGSDFGLSLLALIAGEDVARARQLELEYDPAPPFRSGSPAVAAPELVETVHGGYCAYLNGVAPHAQQILDAAANRLGVQTLG